MDLSSGSRRQRRRGRRRVALEQWLDRRRPAELQGGGLLERRCAGGAALA